MRGSATTKGKTPKPAASKKPGKTTKAAAGKPAAKGGAKGKGAR